MLPLAPASVNLAVVMVTDNPVFCVAIVPKPKLVLAVDAEPKSERLLALYAYVVSAPVAVTPKLVLAPDAVLALVPPDAIPRGVPIDRVVNAPVEGVIAPIGVLLILSPDRATPPIVPPDITTLLAFWDAIVPNPPAVEMAE